MYLDPGFGGMLLQIIVALVATGGAVIFAMRRKIKVLFSKEKNEENSAIGTNITNATISVGDVDDAIDTLSGERENK